MGFKKGEPRHPKAGRKRGSGNRVQKAVKEAVLEALNDGAGAVEFFVKLKNSRSAEDRRCFAHVAARLIPTEIKAAIIPVLPVDPHDLTEIARRAAFLLQSGQIAQRALLPDRPAILVNETDEPA